MRILYICADPGIPVTGTKGASIHVRSLTGALAELGHDVLILAARRGDGDTRCPVPCCTLPEEERTAVQDRIRKQCATAAYLSDRHSRELETLAIAGRLTRFGLKKAASFSPDVVIERLSLFSRVGAEIAIRRGIPFALEVNAPITAEAARFRSLNMRALAERVEMSVLRRADRVMAVSRVLRAHLVEHGVDAGKVHVIPNGVDTRLYQATAGKAELRRTLNLPEGFLVGFIGSLKPWHGMPTLLEAFARLRDSAPDATLVVVGTGPELTTSRELAQRLGVDGSVVWAGARTHAEVPLWLRAVDVAVAPFHDIGTFYFSPIKVFEYMASDVCVVASRLGQIADVIIDGINGLLCRPGDAEDLASAFSILRASPSLRTDLATRAAELVREKFTWRRTAQLTQDTLREARDEVLRRSQALLTIPARIAS